MTDPCCHRNLLVLLEDGERAAQALAAAVEAARATRGRLSLLHVIDTTVTWMCFGATEEAPTTWIGEAEAHGEALLRNACASLPDDVPCTTYLLCARAPRSRQVLGWLQGHPEVDAIVVGLRCHGFRYSSGERCTRELRRRAGIEVIVPAEDQKPLSYRARDQDHHHRGDHDG